MSYEYYSQWWIATKKQLDQLTRFDRFVSKPEKPFNDRRLCTQLLEGLYLKYSRIVQRLGVTLDQMAQPQKRLTVKKLFDAATLRLAELNEELKKIDLSEYHYVDGAICEFKLVPRDVEILDPIYPPARTALLEELCEKLKKGERIYFPPVEEKSDEEIRIRAKSVAFTETETKTEREVADQQDKPPNKTENQEEMPQEKPKEKRIKKKKKFSLPAPPPLTEEELEQLKMKEKTTAAVKLIQTHERARQCRLYFSELFSMLYQRKQMALGIKPPPPAEPQIQENSAIKIQSIWRGHAVRKRVKYKENERRLVMGMVEPSLKTYDEYEILTRNLEKRRKYRDQRIQEYLDAIENERTRVFKVVAPRLMEDIGEEIREWFYVWYKEIKTFDKFLPEEKGGTILVIRYETMTPKQFLEEKEKQKKKKKGKSKQDKVKEKEKQKKLAAAKKKKELAALKRKKELEEKKRKSKKFGEFDFEFGECLMHEKYNEAAKEYTKLWQNRQEDPDEKPIMDLINEEENYQMQLQVRRQVDEMMRIELEMLQDAVARDKKKKKRKKKKKKKPKKKNKKGKGPKDPTGNRCTEDLFQELVDNGIIHPYKKTLMSDYWGDNSYNNWELRYLDFDPTPTLGDVRQLVKLYCVLPLYVDSMKKVKSVLLCGPKQSGKEVLSHAVFTETQSVLFDLSPEITCRVYPGKKGLKMLFHLVNKMSRILQPSIIYIKDAERVFYKKVPKEEKYLDPKRIGGSLTKQIVKGLKPEDQVLLLGTCGRPWMGKFGKMKKTFEKMIFIPRPDYGSVYMYWRSLLMPYHGVDRNFEISPLTLLTAKKYTLPDIKKAVETVLTPRRIVKLAYKPLQQKELLEVLLQMEPINEKEWEKNLKFFKKLPLGKQRAHYNEQADAFREKMKQQAEKAKK